MTTRKMALSGGLYFDEFEPGDSVVSVGRTITESDIVNFAALSGDWNRIHTDAEYAKTQLSGQRIAHGLLVLSIASGLAVRLGFMEDTIIVFREMQWKFIRPVLIGDTIRLRVTVEATKEMARLGGGMVTLRLDVLNQRDEIAQRGLWELLCKARPA